MHMIMLDILLNNIFPIFVLVGLGFILSKKFSLDINTLNKINFYLLVPTFTFVYLYTTMIPLDMIKVFAATAIIMALNYIIAVLASRARGFDSGMRGAFINSILFYNSGNIGIPLITLVFSSAPFVVDGQTPWLNIALTSQIMVLVVQNITTNTLGFFNAGRSSLNTRESIGKIFKMPAIYTIPLAFLLKLAPFDLTQMIFWPALSYLRNALVPMALIILGVQISRTRFHSFNSNVFLASFVRLLGGPALMAGIIYLLGIRGVIAQAVFISSAVPTSVNSALIAVEYDNHPDFASQTVLTTTLACTVTLSVVIYLARVLFPV